MKWPNYVLYLTHLTTNLKTWKECVGCKRMLPNVPRGAFSGDLFPRMLQLLQHTGAGKLKVAANFRYLPRLSDLL